MESPRLHELMHQLVLKKHDAWAKVLNLDGWFPLVYMITENLICPPQHVLSELSQDTMLIACVKFPQLEIDCLNFLVICSGATEKEAANLFKFEVLLLFVTECWSPLVEIECSTRINWAEALLTRGQSFQPNYWHWGISPLIESVLDNFVTSLVQKDL